MSQPFLREFIIPAMNAGTQYIVLQDNVKLSESGLKKFVPFLGCIVTNNSPYDITVFFNEVTSNAIRLPPNSSRGIEGYAMHDITVRNDGSGAIAAGEVLVTVINDFEQCARYAAIAKRSVMF